MKKIFTILTLAVLFVACSKEYITIDTLPTQLSVSFADDDSRVHLDADKKAVWDSGDLVSVFYKNSANGQWRYAGTDGERNGVIIKVSEPNNPSASFSDVYAVYPYMESTTISGDGVISLVIPTEQTFLNGSYGKGDNIMVAAGDNDNLSMKNVFGWVRIPMTGTGQKVSSLVFEGNHDEVLAGAATVDPYTQKITFADGGTKTLTLNCNDVMLEEGKTFEFYIAVAPQTFSKGFTVDILLANGDCVTKSTTNSVTINRNHICPMVAVVNPTQTSPLSNEIWYTNGSATEATSPYKTDVFGAKIVSNTYNAERECWVLKFDGDITSIGKGAFYECSSLTSITIPDGVTSIGDSAFSGCSSLTSITIPDSVTSIGKEAFWDCSLISITIPDSVTSIGDYAFCGCSSLTSVTIPDSVTSIGESTFVYCSSLISVTIGKGVTSIVDYAFYECSSLTSITIPDGVTSIGVFAFSGCSSLTSITIPDGVTSIGDYAFWACSSLTSVTIGKGVASIGAFAFHDCSSLIAFYGKYASSDNRCLIVDGKLVAFAPNGLTIYSIPDGVTSIEKQAFHNCSNLTNITIPDSVTSIGDAAFFGCSSLTSITIPDSVTSIGYGVFESK